MPIPTPSPAALRSFARDLFVRLPTPKAAAQAERAATGWDLAGSPALAEAIRAEADRCVLAAQTKR